MVDLLGFLADYEVLIYLVLAIGGMFSFRWLYRSWREWRVAVYGLEREFSLRRLGRSGLISFLIALFFCFEFSVATFVVPGLPADFFLATPTLDFISSPTGTLSAALMTQFANQPQSTPQPGASGCVPGRVELTFPEPGAEIKEIGRAHV